jgi:energy-coupling factor transporter transmembrane protein EcfT
MLALFNLYASVSTSSDTIKGFRVLLRPLCRLFHLREGDAALTLALTLRFIDVLRQEAVRIGAAQISRGALARGKGLLRRAAAVALPLFLRTLERAEKTAQAVLLRL